MHFLLKVGMVLVWLQSLTCVRNFEQWSEKFVLYQHLDHQQYEICSVTIPNLYVLRHVYLNYTNKYFRLSSIKPTAIGSGELKGQFY